ncbi:hypothetical protein RvY_14490 [Ramazzottius varieornatus]|uniref:Small ribosomal subunit protein uS10m n=1 Tax=Ramazzottius varieornatus TaxID=947166 RepID=A0A1D1VYU5_RAMVA|nr:hypothetical protein RvY_14490 [Ramazzottius varieornatus]
MAASSAARLLGRTTAESVVRRHDQSLQVVRCSRSVATRCCISQGRNTDKRLLGEKSLAAHQLQHKRCLTKPAKKMDKEDAYLTLGSERGFQDNLDERDKLYKMIELELRGHEEAVLDSYQWFLTRAAEELGIKVSRVYTPLRNYNRFSLLKSAFVYKKHMVQYEIRTYFRVIQMKRLTGSTADTYLEYVQRNLPEGVAMKVLACEIEGLPVDVFAKDPKEKDLIEQPQEKTRAV